MAKIMDLFAAEMDGFISDCEQLGLLAQAITDQYPPRIKITGQPMYVQQSMLDDEPQQKKMVVVVSKGVETTVEINNAAMRKKEMNGMITKAEKLLELYVHGFMQEKIEN